MAALSGVVGRLGPLLVNPVAATVAFVAALTALAGAAVVATGALLKFAIATSNVRREEALQIEGLNTLRTRWGLATASVEEFQTAIDRASDSTNVGRGTLQSYARQLSRAGLRGDALTQAVEAMGIAAQVQGDRGANRFRALAINARLTGGSVRDLAESYRNRLGPIARRQMLSLDNQTERLRRSLDRIFSGLNLEPFLEGIDEILSLFSQTTSTGKALKRIVEVLFQPILDQTGVIFPVVKRFFQGMVIGALLGVVAIQRVSNKLEELFPEAFKSDFNFAKAALFAGVAAFGTLTAFIALTTLALGAFAVAMLAASAPLILLGALIAGAAVLGFKLAEALGEFFSMDVEGQMKSLIDGLVEAVTGSGSRVGAAFQRLAQQGIDSFRSALGISSPSRVFAEFGRNITQGTEKGIESGKPDVQNATANLVDAPEGAGAGGTTSISIGEVIVQAGESSNPRELAVMFRDELASVLEGVGVEVGVSS